MKRSAKVTLITLGTALLLSGCNTERKCEDDKDRNCRRSNGTYINSNYNAGRAMLGSRTAPGNTWATSPGSFRTYATQRSGFGSVGRGFSAGG